MKKKKIEIASKPYLYFEFKVVAAWTLAYHVFLRTV